ncbi:MAG: DegT/DnrJ/EryC1/StrS family aminotransferase [Rhodospirillales bacterium]
MKVPFLDLKAQYATVGPQIEAEVVEVLRSGGYVLGPKVAAFEEAFATLCGTKHAVACNSGTSALHLAFVAHGIRTGDEVIVPAMSFTATAAAVRYTGATPVFVDIEATSLTLDPALIEAAITPATKAIVPVHLYGQPARMDDILAIAKVHGLPVIEDAAQAHGALDKGRPVGGLGRCGCFSFYPGKKLRGLRRGGNRRHQ